MQSPLPPPPSASIHGRGPSKRHLRGVQPRSRAGALRGLRLLQTGKRHCLHR